MNRLNQEKVIRLLWLSEAGVSWEITESAYEAVRKSTGWSSKEFYEFVDMLWFFDVKAKAV